MPIFNNILAGASGQSTGYDIDQSLRFNGTGEGASGDYLSRTTASAGSGSWTLSTWVKPSNLSDGSWASAIFGAKGSSTYATQIYFQDDDKIRWFESSGGVAGQINPTTSVFRDPSAWYHLVFQKNGSTSMKIYKNGELLQTTTTTVPATSSATESGATIYIGQAANTSSTRFASFCGYQAEVHFIDGTVLDASSFGETDAATNQWKPIEVTGLTYGTNGFYQKYSATELANSFTDSAKSAVDSSDRESEIAVTSSFTWAFSSSGNTDGEDLVNGIVTNNDAGGGWMPSGDVTDRWIKFDFGSGKVYTKCQWISINSTGGEGTWKWQGSNNDSEWTDIGGTFTLGAGEGGSNVTYTLGDTLSGNTTSYRYYRILGTTGSANASGRRLAMYFGGWSDGVGHTITANGDVANTRAQYKVGDSSIKFDGTGDYLSTPDSDDWDFGTGNFTWEAWVRLDDVSDTGLHAIISHGSSSSAYNNLIWSGATTGTERGWSWYQKNGSGGELWNMWTLDQGSYSNDTWYHVAIVRNGDVFTLYVDGVSKVSETHTDALVDFNTSLKIGSQDGSARFWDGYMDEIRISDSARYTTTFTPSTTEFTADANTKLLIHSEWNGGLGADSSGNKNDFAVTNLVATDVVIDTPTNNYCTMNPLAKASSSYNTLKEGNLHLEATGQGSAMSTFAMSSGQWYWECLVTIEPTWWPVVGFSKTTANLGHVGNQNWTGDQTGSWGYLTEDGKWYVDGSTSSTYTAVSAGDIMQFAIDMDAGKAWVGINNTWVNSGNPSTGANAIVTSGLTGDITPVFSDSDGAGHDLVANFGQDSSFAGAKTAQGNGGDGEDFYYTPPSGFAALNTDNLSDPAIALPTDHFNPVIFTGDGTDDRAISVGFQPDLVWMKQRTDASGGYVTDSVRGNNEALQTTNTNAEGTFASMTFTSTGITVSGNENLNNEDAHNYVFWNWKAGGTAASNTDGTITSSVSANPTAGFSILTFSGNSNSTSTVGHGLSQSPELIIVKGTSSAQEWSVWHDSFPVDSVIYLNSTGAAGIGNQNGRFDVLPTASVFTPGSEQNTNATGVDYVSYCFHSIEGYSKVGGYTGNGVADGTFIYTGFRPAYVFFKCTSASSTAWNILDTTREDDGNTMSEMLQANNTIAEFTSSSNITDFLSNGIKLRGTSSATNGSGNTYIYLAFAASPFKTSNAR